MSNVGEYCREQEFHRDDGNNLDSAELASSEVPSIGVLFVYKGETKKNVPSGVKHVTVDPSVRRIEKRSFSGCTWLAKIKFAQGGNLKSIGSQAFQTCQKIIDLELPEGLERIEDDAFFGCECLKKISLPKTVETIGTMAFCGCSALVRVHLCEGLKVLGPQAFRSCTSLVTIDLPNGLKVIGKSTFHWCKSLRTIAIPDTVEIIEAEAFRNCASLQEVTFPQGLRFIGKCAFQDCKALNAVGLPSTLEEMDSYAFYNCSNLLCLEIPKEMNAKFNNSCLSGCNSLVTMSIRKSDETLVRRDGSGCLVLFQKQTFVDRFAELPVHGICYNSSSATVDELIQAIDSCNILQDEYLKDVLGMTPFHIIATSPYRRVDMLTCLLERYPPKVVAIKDELGMTAMDYLLKQTSSRVVPLIQAMLQKVLVEPFGVLEAKWRLELSLRLESIDLQDNGDRPTTRRQGMNSLLEYVGHCTRIEMITIAELALWKMKMRKCQTQNSENELGYRESCRCQSGADVAIDNIVGYLWDDNESKDCTALSVYPICSMNSSKPS